MEEDEIRFRLGPEGRHLFSRWESTTGMQMAMAADKYYVQGLRDALAVILAAPGGKTFYAMAEETRGRAPDQATAPSDRWGPEARPAFRPQRARCKPAANTQGRIRTPRRKRSGRA